MWPFDETIVAVDARSVAVMVVRDVLGRRSVQRFESSARASRHAEEPLRDVEDGAIDEARRLVRSLSAPVSRLAVVLPVGAAFPAIVATDDARWVEIEDLLRFRLAPMVPFPMADAATIWDRDVRTPPGRVFAEVLPAAHLAGARRLGAALGCERPRIHSALGAALRALPIPTADLASVDAVFGDAAYAIAERDRLGALVAVTTRLLTPGEDRAERALQDAGSREPAPQSIRVVGPGAPTSRATEGPRVDPAFPGDALTWPLLRLAGA